MNKATNNEVDLLLRKLARRPRGDSADFAEIAEHSGAQREQQHLDADELNAYAENALPDVSRALYTEHLADCAACRKLVAQLSLASGTTVTAPSVAAKAPSSIKKYLARLFAPRVLRYAGPAFAVIAVLAIAFILNRQKPSSDYVAQNQESGRVQTAKTTEAPQPPVAFDSPAEKNGAVASARKVESKPNSVATPEERQQEQAAAKPKALDSATTVDKLEEAPPASPAPQPTMAREATETAKTLNGRLAGTDDLAKQKKPAPAKDQEAESKEEDRKSDEAALRPAKPKTETSPLQSPRSQGAGISSAVSRDSRRERDKSETNEKGESNKEDDGRTVVGHHFRRQNGIWVDAAYEPSRKTVNVARGSEQYQALVADEPAIRTIAEQLDGVVIVVWKGQAYRIR
jgi:hypothetical protein